MRFNEKELEIVINRKADGKFALKSNSRETYRICMAMQAIVRDLSKRDFVTQLRGKPLQFVERDAEIVISQTANGYEVRSSCRNEQYTYVVLKAVLKAMLGELNRVRGKLALEKNHTGRFERIR